MRTFRSFALAAAAAVMLAGCAAASPAVYPAHSAHDFGKPGPAISVHTHVKYYPACKNEILNFDGRTWFPFTPSNPADFPSDPLGTVPTPAVASPAASALRLSGGLGAPGAVGTSVGRVVAPGPGDDVGTLVIYKNDLAYWQADSGSLHTWLTNQKIEYGWAC